MCAGSTRRIDAAQGGNANGSFTLMAESQREAVQLPIPGQAGVADNVAETAVSSGSIDVLVVDSDPAQARITAGLIAKRGTDRFRPHVFTAPDQAWSTARDSSDTIILADLETIGGPDAITTIAGLGGPVIATSTIGSLNMAVGAVKAGASDFLTKPFGARALLASLEAALATTTRPEPLPSPEQIHAGQQPDFAGFVGRSPAMLAIYEQICRIAPSRAPVFITGESGTGKELCAEAIHANGSRANAPMVAINCSAIPRDLMESEIFGHIRGAFTGATSDRAGAAELADGGTLFLDEIGEMDLGLQAKLLRFIQTGIVHRVGDGAAKKVDVRIVSATNRNPRTEVNAGRLREDLFYRLHVLPIHLPPLRERVEDILPLSGSFLARFGAEEGRRFRGFSPEAAALIQSCPWPGNVRQLQNMIRRIVVLHDGLDVTAAMLPEDAVDLDNSGKDQEIEYVEGNAGLPGITPFREQERAIIEQAVAAFDGNIARAAAALELSPSTIYRKRQAWTERRSA